MNAYARCVECGHKGHFKCTSEKDSLKINLIYQMKGDLDEFSEDELDLYGDASFDYVDITEMKGNTKKKVIDNTNVYMEVPHSE